MKKTLLAALSLLAIHLHAEDIMDAKAINAALGAGMNYGNIFEANPPEGWGVKADNGDFAIMAKAGLKSVRIPVRWSAKAAAVAPYTIDPAFDKQVELAVNTAMRAGLYVVLNMHHYDEIFLKPEEHKARFLGIWAQISKRYAKYPRRLILEILNEPHDKLTPALWNEFLRDALAVIRQDNPDRVIFIGSAGWGGTEALKDLALPKDKNIIFTFHNYSPFQFTHQGADWVGEQSKAWVGKKWSGAPNEVREMREEFEKAVKFAKRFNVPVNLGEYGAYSKADYESRVKWTAAMTKFAKRYNMSHMYWEFKAGGFGAYDEEGKKWRQELIDAIVK